MFTCKLYAKEEAAGFVCSEMTIKTGVAFSNHPSVIVHVVMGFKAHKLMA